MPVVKLTLSKDLHDKLLEEAAKEGLPVQDFIKLKTFGETTAYTPLEAVNKAREKYNKDDTFTVPDIYGDSWDLKRGFSGVFGKRFFNFVEDHPEYGIKFDKMINSGRHAQYKMITEVEGEV